MNNYTITNLLLNIGDQELLKTVSRVRRNPNITDIKDRLQGWSYLFPVVPPNKSVIVNLSILLEQKSNAVGYFLSNHGGFPAIEARTVSMFSVGRGVRSPFSDFVFQRRTHFFRNSESKVW